MPAMGEVELIPYITEMPNAERAPEQQTAKHE